MSNIDKMLHEITFERLKRFLTDNNLLSRSFDKVRDCYYDHNKDEYFINIDNIRVKSSNMRRLIDEFFDINYEIYDKALSELRKKYPSMPMYNPDLYRYSLIKRDVPVFTPEFENLLLKELEIQYISKKDIKIDLLPG